MVQPVVGIECDDFVAIILAFLESAVISWSHSRLSRKSGFAVSTSPPPVSNRSEWT